MIREAELADVPALVEMGSHFHAMSPHKFMGEYDPEGVARVLAFMIDSPQSVVLVSGTGLIGATFSPVYFAPSTWMLEENFWWAQGGGFELLSALLDHGKSWGASFLLLSTLENEHSRAIDRMLTRQGFRLMERRYIKELA